MRLLRVLGLYTALLLTANLALADGGANGGSGGVAGAAALRDGDMKKLNFAAQPVAVPDLPVLDGEGTVHAMSEWRGRWVVLNFWATWCAPCRHEMPSLARLQAVMPELAVLPVATGRNSVEGIEKFFADAGVTDLPVLRDPKSELARALGVLGLPVTLIVDPEGREVARLIGDADWASDSAKAVFEALLAQPTSAD